MPEQATIDFEDDPGTWARDYYNIFARLPDGLRNLAALIREHRFVNPVSGAVLAEKLDVDRRSIAASVECLIIEHGLPIGSVRTSPAGYFWIRTYKEREAACSMLHATAMKLLIRERALKRTTNDDLLNQVRFSLISK